MTADAPLPRPDDRWNRFLPAAVRQNLRGRVLPLGLARLFSLGTPFLLQFGIFWRFGPEEAGTWWILLSAVLLAAMVADAGTANAFPVLFGREPGREHPQLRSILRIRLVLGIFAGMVLGALGGVGQVKLPSLAQKVVLGLLVVGRVVLSGNQGFHFAREQFGTLLAGALVELGVAAAGFGFVALSGGPATTVMIGFALATWLAAWVLDHPGARPFGTRKAAPEAGSPGGTAASIAVLWPFVLCGLGAAIYQRGDAVVAGFVLDRASAGVLGSLEAVYRLAIFPIYMSGIGLFPALRAAFTAGDRGEMARLTAVHRGTGFRLLIPILGLAGAAWLAADALGIRGPDWRMAAVWYLLAIPVAIPNALIMTEYFSRNRQWTVARLSLLFALGRPFLAALLGARLGVAGMALNHLLFDLMQGVVYVVVMPWRERVSPAPG